MKALPLAVLAASALLVGSAGASPAPQKTLGGARAYSIRIVLPGQRLDEAAAGLEEVGELFHGQLPR